jgi:hypothetical protein
VSFAAITLCVASQRVFIVVYFVHRLSTETFGYTLVCCNKLPMASGCPTALGIITAVKGADGNSPCFHTVRPPRIPHSRTASCFIPCTGTKKRPTLVDRTSKIKHYIFYSFSILRTPFLVYTLLSPTPHPPTCIFFSGFHLPFSLAFISLPPPFLPCLTLFFMYRGKVVQPPTAPVSPPLFGPLATRNAPSLL